MITNEKVIWEGHPDFTSWTLMHLSVILLMGFFFILLPTVMIYSMSDIASNQFAQFGFHLNRYITSTSHSYKYNTYGSLVLIPIVLFFLLPGIIFVLSSIIQLLLGWFNTYYTFTDKSIRLQYGIIFKKDSIIPIENIESAGAIKVLGDKIYGVIGGDSATIALRLKINYIPPAIAWIRKIGIDINFPMSIYCVPNAEGILKDMNIAINDSTGFYPEPGVLDEDENNTDSGIQIKQ